MQSIDPNLLDMETVGNFVEMGTEVISSLVDLYIDNSTQEIQALSRHALAGNLDEIKKTAHSLKGASYNTGANAMGMLCLQIEKMTQEHNLEVTRDLVAQLPDLLEKTRLAFLQTYE